MWHDAVRIAAVFLLVLGVTGFLLWWGKDRNTRGDDR